MDSIKFSLEMVLIVMLVINVATSIWSDRLRDKLVKDMIKVEVHRDVRFSRKGDGDGEHT